MEKAHRFGLHNAADDIFQNRSKRLGVQTVQHGLEAFQLRMIGFREINQLNLAVEAGLDTAKETALLQSLQDLESGHKEYIVI